MNESTHFIFDGEKVVISPDLVVIVTFLQEIEKEVESFLGFSETIESIKKQYSETLKLILLLSQKLKDNSIDFEFKLSEHPNVTADRFKIDHPVRSKMIVLFANLEVLLCLNIAYEYKISDKKEIIKRAMNQEIVRSFLENFCLNKDNEWYSKNQERAQLISADDLRKLRNSLTHFFSVDTGVQVVDEMLDEKSRKLEKATDFKIKFLSPRDLYGILKGTAILMIKKWDNDCRESTRTQSKEFKERILCTEGIVSSHGAMVIKGEQIRI